MTNRLPPEKAQITGAAVKDPQRHKKRKGPKRVKPVGSPYKAMTPGEKMKWRELVKDLPWLNSSHRTLLRLACKLAAQMDGDDFGVSKAQALSSILSKLGATPVDASKVGQPDDDDEEDDIFD